MLNIALIKARIAARAEEFLRELFGDRLPIEAAAGGTAQ